MKRWLVLSLLVGIATAQLAPLIVPSFEIIQSWTSGEGTYEIAFHKGAGWQVQIGVDCNFTNDKCATAWVQNPETNQPEYFKSAVRYILPDGTQEQWLTLQQDFDSTGSTIHVVGSTACTSNCQWNGTLIVWIRGGKHPAKGQQ